MKLKVFVTFFVLAWLGLAGGLFLCVTGHPKPGVIALAAGVVSLICTMCAQPGSREAKADFVPETAESFINREVAAFAAAIEAWEAGELAPGADHEQAPAQLDESGGE